MHGSMGQNDWRVQPDNTLQVVNPKAPQRKGLVTEVEEPRKNYRGMFIAWLIIFLVLLAVVISVAIIGVRDPRYVLIGRRLAVQDVVGGAFRSPPFFAAWRGNKLVYKDSTESLMQYNTVENTTKLLFHLSSEEEIWNVDALLSSDGKYVLERRKIRYGLRGATEAQYSLHDVNEGDVETLMDYLQTKFRCCGIRDDGFKDWSRSVYFNCSDDNPSLERCGVPWSCCRNGTGLENALCGHNVQNLDRNIASRTVNTMGCLLALQKWVNAHAVAVGLLGLLEVIIITVVVLQCTHLVNELQMMRGCYRGPWWMWVGKPRPKPPPPGTPPTPAELPRVVQIGHGPPVRRPAPRPTPARRKKPPPKVVVVDADGATRAQWTQTPAKKIRVLSVDHGRPHENEQGRSTTEKSSPVKKRDSHTQT